MNRQDAKMKEPNLYLDELAHRVIGAAIEVHRHLGPGLLESVYEEALAVEMSLQNISFERQYRFCLTYKGNPIGEGKLDFLVGGQLVVELKAIEAIAPIHVAQVISYLQATHHELGLLMNFNTAILKEGIKRIALT